RNIRHRYLQQTRLNCNYVELWVEPRGLEPLLDAAVGDDVRALRAVLQVSQAVLGAHRFNDALEVIAEQTRAALGAASFSISRWEPERGVLHTMINVGELGPGEERWPTDEAYPLADHRMSPSCSGGDARTSPPSTITTSTRPSSRCYSD